MINEIKKRLGSGSPVELECINEIGFTDWHRSSRAKEILAGGKIIVIGVRYDGALILKGGGALLEFEFKHFKIKEEAPTFDDLVELAFGAYRLGALSRVEVSRDPDGELMYRMAGESGTHVVYDVLEDYTDPIKELKSSVEVE